MNPSSDFFLIKNKLNLSYINPTDFISSFISEMEKGLIGHSSLGMKRSYIFKDKLNFTNKKIIVLDIGGTHIRGAVALIKNTKCYFKNFKSKAMIGRKQKVNKEEFYFIISQFIKSISEENLDIGVCFSFNCDMCPTLDGKLIDFGKNIKGDDVKNSFVGQEIKKYFKDNRNIYLLNDACACNLGGEFSFRKKNANYISYILGTGVNASYYEENELINIEVCGFNKLVLTPIEEKLINKIGKEDLFEKITSGIYFGKLISEVLNLANEEKLIKLNKKINRPTIFFSNLMNNNIADNNIFCDKKSYLIAKKIIKHLIIRNAYLNSLVLTSIINKNNSNNEYIISLEGSTLKKLPYFEYYFKKFTREFNKNKKLFFFKGADLNLKGASLLEITHNN